MTVQKLLCPDIVAEQTVVSYIVVAAYTGNVLGGPWAVGVVTVCIVNLFGGDVVPPKPHRLGNLVHLKIL